MLYLLYLTAVQFFKSKVNKLINILIIVSYQWPKFRCLHCIVLVCGQNKLTNLAQFKLRPEETQSNRDNIFSNGEMMANR